MADLDFVEQAAIWSFAGLLAVSATPLAAIAFLTVAPSFVIAMRTGDLGAIVTIYVDGVPAAVVDTYADAPGMLFQSIVADPDTETHQIYVQKDDNPDTIIEVLRKELSPSEITPTNLRWNEDCDCVQQTFDGGDTWVDAPGQDPRSAPGFGAPPLATDDPRCDAAANMVEFLRNNVALVLAAENAVELGSQMLAFIGLTIPAIGTVVALISIIAGLLLALGAEVIAEAFTSDVYDAFLCIFYCNIDNDGQMSDAQLSAIYAAVAAQFDITVQAVFGYYGQLFGPVGWSNAGALGTQTGDCGDCNCTWRDCWTGAVTWENMVASIDVAYVRGFFGDPAIPSVAPVLTAPSNYPGSGYGQDHKPCFGVIDFGRSVHVTHVEMAGGGSVIGLAAGDASDFSDLTSVLTSTGSSDVDVTYRYWVAFSYAGFNPDISGLKITGDGDNPFPENAC